MSLLEVSAGTGSLGPVIVLAGDADGSSAEQLDEVLTAVVSGRTVHLTIDATNLRSIDPATAQMLVLAALIVMVQGGGTVLVNPQEPVLKRLSHARVTEMFTIQDGHRPRPHRTPARPPAGQMRQRPVPMAEHEPDWPVVLRRQTASPGTGRPEDHTGMFEVICGKCCDDPGLDYPEVSSGLRQIRGPYPFAAGIAVFAKHDEHHDTAGETDQRA